MIDKINTNPIQDILGKSSSKQPDSAKALGNNGADVSIQVDYASLVNKAIQAQQADAEAVRRAQKLLKSGQLESLENIREAAENIFGFGI